MLRYKFILKVGKHLKYYTAVYNRQDDSRLASQEIPRHLLDKKRLLPHLRETATDHYECSPQLHTLCKIFFNIILPFTHLS